MDKEAAHAANLLVGNDAEESLIEVTLLGPEIYFRQAVDIAITGAKFPLMLNEEPIRSYEKIHVPADSILSFGYAEGGCRAYLAIAALWEVPYWQGSVSPLSLGEGILRENHLQDRQTLTLASKVPSESYRLTQQFEQPNFAKKHTIRLSLGPESQALTETALQQFLENEHEVSREANRMGIKLNSQLERGPAFPEMVSSGILPGTIQLTSGGQAIILMADAQTVGGYPRIARVLEEELDVLAQVRPGDLISFELVED